MASSVSDEDKNEIFMKVERGANQTLKNYDIDKPRNLAKSVTVE